MAEHIVVRRFALELGRKFFGNFFEIERFQRFTRTTFQRLAVAEDDVLQFLRPAAHRLTEAAADHINDRFRKRRRPRFKIQNIRRLDTTRDQKHRHIANDLAARRHLHDVAEKLVHLRVNPRDFRPAMRQTHGRRLLLQVSELAARHLMQIHFRAAGLRRRVERRVIATHLFPVVGKFIQCIQIQTRVALGELQRGHDGI